MFDPGDKKGGRPGGSLLSVRAYQSGAARRGDRIPRHAGNDSEPSGGTIFSSQTLRSAARSRPARDRDAFDDTDIHTERRQPREPQDTADEWRPLIDPTRLLMAIWRARYFIAAMAIVGGLAGAVVALSIPKLYYATTELQVDPRSLKLVDRELTSSDLPFDATLAAVESQMRIMGSRGVLNNVIDKLNLDADPEFNGTSPPRGVLGLVTQLLSFGDDTSPAVLHTQALETLWSRMNIARDEKSFIVTVTVGSEDPQKAANIANTIVTAYIDFRETMQAGTANAASSELSSRLDELGDKVRVSERAVETFKAENDLLDAQGRLIGDEELLRLNDQLAGARANTIALNARAASVSRLTADDVLGGGLPEQVNSSVLADLRSQYAALKQQYDALAIKLGPRHPELQALTTQIESARGEIAAEIRRINGAMQVDLKRAVQTEQDLAARLAQVKSRQSASKGDLVRLRELERQASADRAVYEAYLLRALETGEQSNINTANISVISPADPPLEPAGSSRKLVAVGGLIAGLLAGTVLAVLFDLLQTMRGFGARPSTPQPTPPADTPPPRGGPQWYRRRNPDSPAARPEPAPPASPGSRFARAMSKMAPRARQTPDEDMDDGAGETPRETVNRPEPAAAQPAPQPVQPAQPAAPAWPAMAPPQWYPAHPPQPVWAMPPMGIAMPQQFPMQPPMAWPYAQPAQPMPAPAQPAPAEPVAAAQPDPRFEQLRVELGDMRRAVDGIVRARRRRA